MRDTEKNIRIYGIGYGLLIMFISLTLFGSYGLLVGAIAIALVSLMGYIKSINYLDEHSEPLSFVDESEILHSSISTYINGDKELVGKLFLLKDQLFFNTQKYYDQKHELSIPINNIQFVDCYMTPDFYSKGFKIILVDGQEEQFLLNGRMRWKKKVMKLITNSKA